MTKFQFISILMFGGSITISPNLIAFEEDEKLILEEYDEAGDVKAREIFDLMQIKEFIEKIESFVNIDNLTNEDVY